MLQDELDYITEREQQETSASVNALLGAQGNPDKAARAIQLAQLVPDPAVSILSDVDRVDAQVRGNMASDIVRGNPALQRYVNSVSVASTLSNDDWARLDSLTNDLNRSERPWAVTRGFITGLIKQNPELYGEAAEAVGHLVPGAESLKAVPGFIKAITPELKDYALTSKKLRDVQNTSEALETLGEMFGGGLSSIVPVLASAALGGTIAGPAGAAVGAVASGAPLSLGEVYKALKDEGLDKEAAAGYAMMVLPVMAGLDFAGIAAGPLGQVVGLGSKEVKQDLVKRHIATLVAKGIVKGAAAEGLTEGAQELVKAATVSYATGKEFFSVDVAFDALEAAIGGALVGAALHGPAALRQQRQEMTDLNALLRPYVKAGVEPPFGIHPAIDKFKIEQGKFDVDELDNLVKQSLQALTRERSPETFERLMKDNVSTKVFIPFSEVARLYGDNMPQPDDKILGWVPNLMEQMRVAHLTNGNIVIPKSIWLSKIDPEVMKELHDHIRTRESGVSIQEAKDYREMAEVEVFHGSQREFEAWGIDPSTGQPMETALTGEGAATYGHPLEGGYFAGNRATAENYRLAGGFKPKSQNELVAYTAFNVANGDVAAAIDRLDKQSQVFPKGSAQHREHRAAINLLKNGWRPETQGNLYRVRLKVDPEQLLDWDKPLTEQPPAVQEKLRSIGFRAEDLGPGETVTGDIIYRRIHSFDKDKAFASRTLKEAGIPGIQYLDQGSRAKAGLEDRIRINKANLSWLEGEAREAVLKEIEADQKQLKELTYNYVIFDRDLIEILDRNGEAVDAVRRQAGLIDLAQVPPAKKVTLERRELTPEELEGYEEAYGPGMGLTRGISAFTMRDSTGKDIGLIHFREQGTNLVIEYVRADAGPQSIGLSAVRDMINQLKVEFPNAETLDGFRVSGAREKASDETGNKFSTMKISLKKATDKEIRDFAQSIAPKGWDVVEPIPEPKPLPDEEVRYYSKTTKAYVLPKEKWHWVEKVIEEEVNKVLDRIAPGVRKEGVGTIVRKGGTVRGIFFAGQESTPTILWALDSKDPFGTARHEAIHYLRDQGFFTKDEWETLKTAAIEGDWIGQHNIASRYHDATPELQLEEAIAEHYAQVWSKDPAKVKGAVGKVFEKLHILLVEIQEAIARALGHKPTIDELFEKVESGEIGSRTGTKPLDVETQRQRFAPEAREMAQKDQGELDVTRQEDKPIFETGSAIGVSQATLDRIEKLIAQKAAEDVKAQRDRAIAHQRKIQSAEWKDASEEMEVQVREDLKNRPDIDASNFFRYGELHGQKVEGRKPQLDSFYLTPEQRAVLPHQWLSQREGIRPDDAAQLFGYTTGDQLVQALAQVEQVRGNVRPGEFFHRLVKAETHRRMVDKYGQPEENILSEAEEHVLGQTQMDLLHQYVVADAEKLNAQRRGAGKPEEEVGISLSKQDIQDQVENAFLGQTAEDVSVQRSLRDMGDAGRKIMDAISKEDLTTVYKERQVQHRAGLMAREAVIFEKQMRRLDRLMNRGRGTKGKGA